MGFIRKPKKFGRWQNWRLKQEKKKQLRKTGFSLGEPEDVSQVWSLDEKDAYVVAPVRKRLPQLVLSVGIFLALTAAIFWLLPYVVERFYGASDNIVQELTPELLFAEDTAVVKVSVTNLFSEARAGSERKIQLLYNEPVRVIREDEKSGFSWIQTTDGLQGYVKTADLLFESESVEPRLHRYKLVISDPYKRVMTHAVRGTLCVEVMMNTVLYSDFKGDGVYQVALPGGGTGWISSSGVVELGVDKSIEKVGARYFVSSAQSFHYATLIPGGISVRGASVNGIVYVCAGINGLEVPRLMKDQFHIGEEVPLRYDPVSQILDMNSFVPGDLIFFRDPKKPDSQEPYEMGIYMDTSGMVLMNHMSRTTVRVLKLEGDDALKSRVIAVRRIF